MVCEQTCSGGNEIDKSVWRTFDTFDLLHSSHMWTPAILLCGKHSTTLQIRDCFKTQILQETLKTRSQQKGGIRCIFGCHTFVPISWMRKKQTSVSHSSTEAEVISLDAGLRMDAIPALDLWDLVIEVFHSSPNQTNKTKDVREPRGNQSATPQPHKRKQIPTTNTNLDLINIDHISSNGTRSGSNAMLFVFEDNEAVIKMIIKGRSPTMRHVSRTHRVALDWLFDRINLDSKIQVPRMIPNINSQTFWSKAISHVTNGIIFFICSTSVISALLVALRIPPWLSRTKKMAKRVQEQKDEERIVAKSRPTAMNLSQLFRQDPGEAHSGRETGRQAGREEIRELTKRRVKWS